MTNETKKECPRVKQYGRCLVKGCSYCDNHHSFGHSKEVSSWEEGLRGLLMEALGEASMCWSEVPSGVFESDRAIGVGEKLEKKILKIITVLLAREREAERKKIIEGLKTEVLCHDHFGYGNASVYMKDVLDYIEKRDLTGTQEKE